MITTKQLNWLNSLIKQSNYILIVDPATISKKEASAIIAFLKNGEGDYSDLRKSIRLKGPKIPNLVGDFLYEDF